MTDSTLPPGQIAVGGGYVARDPGFADPGAPPIPFEPIGAEWLERPLFERFDAMVEKYADRVAVQDAQRTLTYADVSRCANGFAAQIAAAGDPTKPVAAILHNTAAFPSVLLAAHACGRVFVPIDASHPAERQEAILREAGAGLVIATSDKPANLDFVPAGIPRLHLDLDDPGEGERPVCGRGFDEPAGLVFTSGSTGRPKGVAVSERAYLMTIVEHANDLRMTPDDVVLGFATLSAAGARETLTALFTGARLRLVDFKAEGLERALAAASEATILAFVPSVMRMVIGIPGAEQAFGRLRVLALGGEQLLKSDIELFAEKLPNCRLLVEFGSTEATSVFRWFVRPDAVEGATSPQGYIAQHQTVLIADPDGKPAAPGTFGELVVRSRRISVGIWRDGALGQGAMVPDPGEPGVRVFHTGDLVRIRPDGLAEFSGRIDRMVKVRGLQVDLSEVEAAMRIFEGVHDAVAVSVTADGQPARIVAFVVGRDGPVEATALRRHVAAETAEHMAPTQVVMLDEIPRLASHKPDLVRLEAMAVR